LEGQITTYCVQIEHDMAFIVELSITLGKNGHNEGKG
jgi:hypothetical protein